MEKKMYKIEIRGDVNDYVLGRIMGFIEALSDETQRYPITCICDVSRIPWRKHKIIANEVRVNVTDNEFNKIKSLIDKTYPNLCTYFSKNG